VCVSNHLINVSAVNITGELNRREKDADANTASRAPIKIRSCTVVSDADSSASTADCSVSSFDADPGHDSDCSDDASIPMEEFSLDLDAVLGTNNSKDEIGLLVKEALIDFASF